MNRLRNGCDIKTDENIYLKSGTVCKICYNNNRKNNNNNSLIQNPQPEIKNNNNNDNNPSVSAYENHRQVIIRPSNVGRTLYMLKKI